MTENGRAPLPGEDTDVTAIVRADPVQRRRLVVLLAVGVGVGLLALAALTAHVGTILRLAERDQELAMLRYLRLVDIVLATLAVGIVALAAYLAKISWRILRDERYPPLGATVLTDTPLLTGAAARRRGRAGLAVALGTAVFGTLLVLFLDRAFERALVDAQQQILERLEAVPPR